MADVNVEFGAKDTGLEATLKTVQEQMTKLESEVKGGTLSFEELSQKMRQLAQAEKIDQKLRNIGDASAEAAPKVNDLGDKVLDAGRKSDQSAGLFDASFQKIAGAFTVGNLAAMGFEKAIDLAFSAARAVVDAFGQALDLGGRLTDLSARTGETAGKLLVLEQAFRDSGLSADQVGVAINKLQNFMAEAQSGGEAQAQAMQRLGISMADLAGKTPTQQMQVFAQAISAIEDPTQRAAIAGDVFGEKLGGRLLPLLTQFSPALDDAGTKVGSLATVMDENAATFDQAGETIDAVKGKLTAFAAGILSETVPAVQELGNSLEMVDAAGLGEKIGATLAPILRGITQDIKILNQFISSLGQGIRSLTEPIVGTAQKFDELAQKIGNVAKIAGALIPNQLSPMGVALNGITDATGKLADKQTEAGAAIEQTGIKAQQTAEKITAIPAPMQGANENILGINNSLTATGGLLDEQKIKLGTINSEYEIWKGLTDQGYDKTKDTLEAKSEIAAKLQESIQLEIDLNNAKAAGNEELVKELESRKQAIADQEQINKLTEEYKKTMPEEVARKMAEEMVKSQRAAGAAKDEIKEFKSFVDLIAGSKPDEPIKKLSEKTADARKEIEAFGKYIGEDLKGMSMPDIAKKLGVDTLGMDGSEQIDAIVKHIESELPKAKQGVVDEGASKEAVAATAKKAGEDLKQALDYSVQTGEGGKVLASIEKLVDNIKTYVDEIRGKLPMQALAY